MSRQTKRLEQPRALLAISFVVAVALSLLLIGCRWHGEIAKQRVMLEREPICADDRHDKCNDPSTTADLRAANAAEDAVDLGFIQVLLSVASFVGLFYTVAYARGAWLAAASSAEAANEALRSTQDGERRQLRAYVVIQSGSILSPSNAKKRRVRLTTENYGQTPAVQVATWRTVIFDDYPLQKGPDVEPPSYLRQGADIFPPNVRQTVELDVPVRLTRAELRAWLQERKAFYIMAGSHTETSSATYIKPTFGSSVRARVGKLVTYTRTRQGTA